MPNPGSCVFCCRLPGLFSFVPLICLFFQAKSQFKSRSIANNVEIIIPVPNDVDSPTFKASIGSVAYLPDQVLSQYYILYSARLSYLDKLVA